jgi:hypothetical protein
MRRGAYATIRGFSGGYELGQGRDRSGLLCVDWQTANALMLRSAGWHAALVFSGEAGRREATWEQLAYRGFASPLCNGTQS